MALFDAIKRIHRGPIKFSRNLRPSPLRYFARASRSDKMSGVVEMLKRYFSPFVIVNRVEERIITRGEKRSSKEQFSLKKKKKKKIPKITLLPKIDRFSKFDQPYFYIFSISFRAFEKCILQFIMFTRRARYSTRDDKMSNQTSSPLISIWS